MLLRLPTWGVLRKGGFGAHSLKTAQCTMNYRHIYHAGNFADVAKHVGLLYCLNALKRKDAGFFALDSHAGRGFYDLQAPEAQKSGEAERGVQRLIVNALAISPWPITSPQSTRGAASGCRVIPARPR